MIFELKTFIQHLITLMKFFYCLLIFFIVFSHSVTCYAQILDSAESVFQRYEEYVNSIHSISFEENFRDHPVPNPEKYLNAQKILRKIELKQKRNWSQVKINAEDFVPIFDLVENYFSEILLTTDSFLEAEISYKDESLHTILSYHSIPSDVWGLHLGLQTSSVPLGYIKIMNTYAYLPDLIRNSEKILIQKDEDEHSLVGFHIKSDGLSFEILLDKDKGNAIKYLNIKRETDQDSPQFFEEYHYIANSFIENAGIFFPNVVHTRKVFPAGDFMYKSSDGKNLVQKYPRREFHATGEFINIKINSKLSDNDFQFSVTIPDETEVAVQDALHIKHVWYHGKVVPLTDELALRIVQGNHKFIPGIAEPRFWLMAIGILLVVVGFSLKAKTLIKQWREK